MAVLRGTARWVPMEFAMERVHYVSNTRKGYLLYLTLHPLSHCRYGFNYGCIHFVLMSTEHFFDPTSPQYAFLEAHLQSVDCYRGQALLYHEFQLCIVWRVDNYYT